MSKVRYSYAVQGSEDGIILATSSLRKAIRAAQEYTGTYGVIETGSGEILKNERQVSRHLDDGKHYYTMAVFFVEGEGRAEIHAFSEE